MIAWEELRDQIAELVHEQWMQWARAVASEVSEERRTRWQCLLVPWEELAEEWKQVDREYAAAYLEVIAVYLEQGRKAGEVRGG